MILHIFKSAICEGLAEGNSMEQVMTSLRPEILRFAESMLEATEAWEPLGDEDYDLEIPEAKADATAVHQELPNVESRKETQADFDTAYDKTSVAEGGYAMHGKSAGGETYAGIAREHWPKWEGWSIIDSEKRRRSASRLRWNEKLDVLNPYVRKFYKQNYWEPLGLGNVRDNNAGNFLYDFLMQSGGAGVVINAALKQLGATDVPERSFNSRTVNAINQMMDIHDPVKVVDYLVNVRQKYLDELVAKKPELKKYEDGWRKRNSAYSNGGQA